MVLKAPCVVILCGNVIFMLIEQSFTFPVTVVFLPDVARQPFFLPRRAWYWPLSFSTPGWVVGINLA